MMLSAMRLPCIASGKWRLERSSAPPMGRVRTSPGFGACLVSIAGKYFLVENDGPWYG